MTWFRSDDDLPEHPKSDVLEQVCPAWADLAAAWMTWHHLGCDCARRRTDGAFTRSRTHRAAGYCRPPSPCALAGAISACAPRERPAGPWVTCECGSEMLEDQHAEHLARATRPGVWSLHNAFMASRAERASASSGAQ